jgi:acyl-CoA synthetase (AMP-forming)/AMP-acid ligase II
LDWLTERVNATPEMTALIIGNESWTYGQLNVLVNAACQKLFASGVQPGQVLGVLMPNGLAYVCLVHALARLGVVLLPLNTRLTPAELDWQLTQTGCDWVIRDSSVSNLQSPISNLSTLLARHHPGHRLHLRHHGPAQRRHADVWQSFLERYGLRLPAGR